MITVLIDIINDKNLIYKNNTTYTIYLLYLIDLQK